LLTGRRKFFGQQKNLNLPAAEGHFSFLPDSSIIFVMYPFGKIEKKWQALWEKKGFYRAKDFGKKPKKYILVEFPYPSGDGLHVGHVRGYGALDAVCRKKRMEGFNVMYPIGWDAFGLPTENYAIKKGIHPSVVTKNNIAVFKKQMKSLGLSFDWSREINTSDPAYYKWTQWIFLQFFKHDLAYQAEMPINWCPKCKIGLANEEVIAGRCERCETGTEKKKVKQWMLKIIKYADRLIADLDKVDYLEKIKTQQINWIGRSEGTTVKFQVVDSQEYIEVFTTRVDTIFGVTALVIAPEHMWANELITGDNKQEAREYIRAAEKKSDLERMESEKEKSGVFTGSYCINPISGEKVPIWIGDYVVAAYGGGAVMMVPAHDKRDYQFAKKYGMHIKKVVVPLAVLEIMRNAQEVAFGMEEELRPKADCFVCDGELIDSGEFTGMKSEQARKAITVRLEKENLGQQTVHYKLRDWVFSRQHYWGEPIPVIHCEKCGTVAVPEKDLPVELPYVKKYEPTQTGESPLADIAKWVNVKCPKCGGKAKRETDTMPNWAGSSWYYLRYIDPKNKKSFADSKKIKYWTPVDLYSGGPEHITLHLLYSRFWHKFLYDIKLVPTSEPYAARRLHGIVLAEDGKKMSKSFGNVINPDEIVKNFGADTLRMYEMFMGPFEQAISWSNQGVVGLSRFMNRVWQLQEKIGKIKNSKAKIKKSQKDEKTKTKDFRECEILLHKSIKKITEDIDEMKFNTVVSQLMILVNEFEKHEELPVEIYETFLKLLSPFAPHISEELWGKLSHKKSIQFEKWPKYNPELIEEEKIELVIQINGKVRDKISVSRDITEAKAQSLAVGQEKIQGWLNGKKVIKVIFISGRLINFVIKD